MFFGLIIRMFYMDTVRHHMPHFHIEYQGQEAVLLLPTGDLLEGDLPAKKLRIVQYCPGLDHNSRGRADGQLGVGSQGRACFQN